jgi:CHASE2 domain-containing sensor protein
MKKCEHCGRKYDKGFRGLLTLLVVVLTFGLAYIQIIKGGSETLIPPWVGVILGSVISMYYQSKGGERMREITHEQSGSSIDKGVKD